MSDDTDSLQKAIEKQRLLFIAVAGLNAPGIDCRLRDDEIGALTGCISETIDLIQQAIDASDHQQVQTNVIRS